MLPSAKRTTMVPVSRRSKARTRSRLTISALEMRANAPPSSPPLRLVQPHAQFELAPLRDRVDLAAPGVDAQYVRRVEQLRLAAAKAGQFPLRPRASSRSAASTSSVIRGAVITARASAQFGSMRTSTFMAVPLSSAPVYTARAASAALFDKWSLSPHSWFLKTVKSRGKRLTDTPEGYIINVGEKYRMGVYERSERRCRNRNRPAAATSTRPRSEEAKKKLINRLNRVIGQLGGIKKMVEEDRYCGDILMQVAAVESALQALGYVMLQDHMETCVVEEIQNGNTAIVDEAIELVKKLK